MSSILKLWKKYVRRPYGLFWNEVNLEFYNQIFSERPLLHADFIRYYNELRQNIQTVLEVGCGMGFYPIRSRPLFDGVSYTGIDISKKAIEYCRKHSSFAFLDGDFLKIDLPKYDLVFSHAVIDHIYDIDLFLAKIVKVCGKYAYISAYRGYYPDLSSHEQVWSNQYSCYFNRLSVPKVNTTLLSLGLSTEEFQVRPQASGQADPSLAIEAVIEISKKREVIKTDESN